MVVSHRVKTVARQILEGSPHRSRRHELSDRAWAAKRTLAPAFEIGTDPRVLGALARPAARHLFAGATQDRPELVTPGRVDYRLDLTIAAKENGTIGKLYDKAVRDQWVADSKLPWSKDVDWQRTDRLLFPPQMLPIATLPELAHMSERELLEFSYLFLTWSLCQFYYGEQGARAIASRLTIETPWESARQMASTQVLDEARHIEVFGRYINTKLKKSFAPDPNLLTLLDALVETPHWDISFLGMQILIEGLALGSFRTIQQATQDPLLHSLLGYVIKDEARHVTFGIHSLKRLYGELTEAERRFRKDLAAEFAWLIYQRFMGETLRAEFFPEISRKRWTEVVDKSPLLAKYRNEVFSRIVADLIRVGLIDPTKRGDAEKRFESMGLLNLNSRSTDQLFEEGRFSIS